MPTARLPGVACRGAAVIALNAANEIAVEAFLAGQMSFNRIVEVVREVLDETALQSVDGLEAVVAADSAARERARAAIRHNS